ncbi:MAG TPA: alpha/beta hydrolase [Steroidobacteraceae bacterium]|nr:alpha/beta hydrolase [Steroidobacteraceae bacterium]
MRGALAALLWLVSPMAPAAQSPTVWHTARIHGHPIVYAVRGEGPTLLLLHGGGDSGTNSFQHQLDVFAEHHRIVAPDQVGQGRTPEVPGPLSYTAMMQDTAALLAQLKLHNVDVVGFSDGGILALMLALRHPDMVRRAVISGVNVSPEGLSDANLEALRAVQIEKPKTIDEKLARLWLTSPTDTELSLDLLQNIRQPVLVVSGDRDAITLEHTLKIFHALPTAELCILPGTDHGTFSARPEWLNPIIQEFLNRPDPGPTPPAEPMTLHLVGGRAR